MREPTELRINRIPQVRKENFQDPKSTNYETEHVSEKNYMYKH